METYKAVVQVPSCTLRRTGSGVNMMKGVEFVIDDSGQKKAVLIDLKQHGQVWEDFYDTLRAKERECEPRESFKEVKQRVLGRS